MAVVSFFVAQWTLSLLFHSFFLHRYCAHRMFIIRPGWARFFHLCTYVTQGTSYMPPRAYALLHRMHHAFSDTPRDPHSPSNHRNVISMMLATRKAFDDLQERRVEPEARFEGGYPEWPALERFGNSWTSRLGWGAAYVVIYSMLVTQPWQWVLLPFQFVIGPIQGAVVNWCGHRFGYRNYPSQDGSTNALWIDVITFGELYQNNHHRFAMSPNFATRWFEVDLTYQFIRCLVALGTVDLCPYPQRMRPPASVAAESIAS